LQAGRQALTIEAEPALVSWTGTTGRLDAVLAGGNYIRRLDW